MNGSPPSSIFYLHKKELVLQACEREFAVFIDSEWALG
jgi:hypothetical protein